MVDPSELTESERRLVRARRSAARLAVALVRDPFSLSTLKALRAYTERDAGPARESFAQLQEQPAAVLRARVEKLSDGDLGEAVPGPGGSATS